MSSQVAEKERGKKTREGGGGGGLYGNDMCPMHEQARFKKGLIFIWLEEKRRSSTWGGKGEKNREEGKK